MTNKNAKIHTAIGITLITLSVLCAVVISPNVAPEFSGRAKIHLAFTEEAPSATTIAEKLATVNDNQKIAINHLSENEYEFTTQALNAEEYADLKDTITESIGAFQVKEYQSFSPSISKELLYKGLIALLVAIIIIIIYISIVFKKASRPVESWKYGVVATVALVHDTIIPLGIFSAIAPFTTATVDTLFVTALLATLGYSINDTIVVFDRIRDKLRVNREKNKKEVFSETVKYGIRNSFRRSAYTSISTIVPLVLLFIFVSATKWFSIALLIGVIAGTYSSLFFAPSILLLWNQYFPQKEKKQKNLSETEAAEKMLRETFHGEDVL